jgi:arylsulfatase A-like enzyme
MFEEATRVPFLLRLPGQTRGRRVTGPVSQIDVVPTLLDLMGQPIPSHLQGQSLKPLLEDASATTHEEDVIVEWNGPNNGLGDLRGKVSVADWMTELGSRERIEACVSDPVRTIVTPDGWKFNCSPLGEDELYNLNDDPLETRNLAGLPEHASLMADLLERLRRWQERTGDTVEFRPA